MKADKKGFIFVESIVVLIILLVALMGVYNLFSNLTNKAERKNTYDNINDIYKVNILYGMVNKSTISNDLYVLLDKNNCSNNMNNDCAVVIDTFNVDKILVINLSNWENSIINSNIGISNTMKEYLKTLNKEKKQIIVSFSKNNIKYYSSLEYV